MITVRHAGIQLPMEPDQLVAWLYGFHCRSPFKSGLEVLSLRASNIDPNIDPNIEILADLTTTQYERYSITLGGTPTELPADWVLSWVSGLAARNGVDILSLLDPLTHKRSRRMRALMICHQRQWLEYVGITEGN